MKKTNIDTFVQQRFADFKPNAASAPDNNKRLFTECHLVAFSTYLDGKVNIQKVHLDWNSKLE